MAKKKAKTSGKKMMMKEAEMRKKMKGKKK